MAKTTSKSKQNYYAVYKATQRWKKNREARLLKAMREQPNNQNVVEALANLKYRRKTPTNPQWSHSDRAKAQILKYFAGHVTADCFSSNPQVQAEALRNLFGTHNEKSLPQGKVSFRLGDRLQGAGK